jgi:hypothetical protein
LDWVLLASKEEWELSYTSAKKHLLHDAEKVSSLDQIYNDPSHFAGWFLKNTVPAEQNHSSGVAHLGADASLSVAEQVSKLLSWQMHLTSKRQQKDSHSYVGSLKYKYRLQDQAASDDEASKKKLLQYPYNKQVISC